MVLRFYAAVMAVLLLAPLPARADDQYGPTPLTAVQVLLKAKAARGGLASGTYEIVETSHGGGMDETDTTDIGPDGSVTHTVTGPFQSASGDFRGQGWEQDENGIVTMDSNFHATEDPNERALAHPEDPANRVTILGITQTSSREYAVDVNPPDGQHEIRYYAADTFLLDRTVVYGSDRLRHVTTYDDYRPVFGAVRAFHTTYSDGRSDNDTDIKIASYQRVKGTVDLSIPPRHSIFQFTSLKPVQLPARFVDGRIILRANVGSRGLDFLLDTGASGMTINPDVAKQLGLTAYGQRSGTIGGSYNESQTVVPDMTIGDLHVKNAVFSEVPVEDQARGLEVVGLLGFDFVGSSIVAIDFKKETVTLYPPGAPLTVQGTLMPVALQLDDDVPRVTASFNGVTGKFLLDTGAQATLVFKHFLNTIPGIDSEEGEVGLDYVGGAINARAFLVDKVLFGPVMFQKVSVLVPQSSTGEITDYDGMLGRDVLSYYVMFIDYANRQIYLQPNP
ncbi:MAG TPA: aspartyl protease family protein [Candidatus Baltobacteraceae bacterium]